MLHDTPFVQIDLTPEYKRNLRELSKKYRKIRLDTQQIIEQLQGGNFIGDRIPVMGEEYVIFKVRVKNSDIQKGKSAGDRLIYQVESPTSVLLLTIYSKLEREDISPNEISSILAEFEGDE
ncbi:type II toxin-antitoxin system RelE/ParE family toxin [Planktothrix sp. FACHB-1355]|uniref:Type II toxin-antitoxin system RelE/ParE family toxin n=1 Tax=Aerosakkonema funiforme FACHB-1375 TaxID=2949571 RepID=A0A926VBM9_9CYAN|nr:MULTISPECIES: type II toxin-antitoxin system RelE/ParE family toxin [Oscillatoriales]MBD2179609.1 type II toxin-antitoxin system RelE/ParE family toxin [Aerosakkonema funiforme FACHB-1375]MBD3561588.1 type II toxin-antitoxin system RelE/ParE family toxin [Planktothrix sp. FACHB-1355]